MRRCKFIHPSEAIGVQIHTHWWFRPIKSCYRSCGFIYLYTFEQVQWRANCDILLRACFIMIHVQGCEIPILEVQKNTLWIIFRCSRSQLFGTLSINRCIYSIVWIGHREFLVIRTMMNAFQLGFLHPSRWNQSAHSCTKLTWMPTTRKDLMQRIIQGDGDIYIFADDQFMRLANRLMPTVKKNNTPVTYRPIVVVFLFTNNHYTHRYTEV